MALACSNVGLNGPPSKTLCALPAKPGQTIYRSLPKKSAPRGRVLHWQDMGTMSTATAFMNMKAGSVN